MTRLAIIAHPRSGTGYAARLFQACGLDIGHERLGRDGISSWWWATPESLNGPPRPPAFNEGNYEGWEIIHLIREPAGVIDSVRFTEPKSQPFRCHYGDIDFRTFDPIQHAIDSLYSWNILISEMKPKHTIATENLLEFVQHRMNLKVNKEMLPSKHYNTRLRNITPLTGPHKLQHEDLLPYPRYREMYALWKSLKEISYDADLNPSQGEASRAAH